MTGAQAADMLAHPWLEAAGTVLWALGVGVLCFGGLVLSALGFSGTWLVVGAAALAAAARSAPFPGWGTVLAFAAVSAAVEAVEFAAGWMGVRRRGGSAWTGLAAVLGGLGGALLGALLPVPVLGPLLGMLAGSFALAWAVESRVGRAPGRAASVAAGALLAHLFVLLLKSAATLGMILYLVGGLLFS